VRKEQGALYITNEGDSAHSLDELIAQVFEQSRATPGLFPLDHSCRISRPWNRTRMQLVIRDDGRRLFEAIRG
jgi:hypothetical protein